VFVHLSTPRWLNELGSWIT